MAHAGPGSPQAGRLPWENPAIMSLSETERGQMLASLRRMGLAGPHETVALEPLTGGVSSLIVLARPASGPVCVKTALPQLRVAAQWLAPVARNRAEVAWLRWVAGIVPALVPEVLGEDPVGHAFAMTWLDPQRHPVWKTELRDGRVDPVIAARVGGALATIHQASAGRPDLAAAFAHDAQFHALRLDPYLGAAALAHPDCADALHRLIARTAGNRIALVHGDVSPKNILCGPHGPVLLDAECAWYGDPAFDLAFLLNHLLLKCAWRPAHAPAYLRCLQAAAQAYLAGVSWEDRDGLQARVAALLGGLLLARIDGKSPVEYLDTEPLRAPVRAAARHLVLHPAPHLPALVETWRAFMKIPA